MTRTGPPATGFQGRPPAGQARIQSAQVQLGFMWGLGRPLKLAEMGRALRLGGRDPGQTVVRWTHNGGPTGPAAVALEMMLAGAPPPDPLSVIVRTRGPTRYARPASGGAANECR